MSAEHGRFYNLSRCFDGLSHGLGGQPPAAHQSNHGDDDDDDDVQR